MSIRHYQNMHPPAEFNNVPPPVQIRVDLVYEGDDDVTRYTDYITDHLGYRFYSLIVQNEPNGTYAATALDVALCGYNDNDGDLGSGDDRPNWFFNSVRLTEASAGISVEDGLAPNDVLVVPVATEELLAHMPMFERIRIRANWRGTLPADPGQLAIADPPKATILLTLYP